MSTFYKQTAYIYCQWQIVVWSGFTLISEAYLSEYLVLINTSKDWPTVIYILIFTVFPQNIGFGLQE